MPKKPFTKPEIARAFLQVEDLMRVRLKTKDLVPVEMSNYRIGVSYGSCAPFTEWREVT